MVIAARLLMAIATLAASAAAANEPIHAEPYRAKEFDAAWAALETVPHVRAVVWLGEPVKAAQQSMTTDPLLTAGPLLTVERQAPARWRIVAQAGCILETGVKIGDGPWDSVMTRGWAPRIATIFPADSIVGDDQILALRSDQLDGRAVSILDLRDNDDTTRRRSLIIDTARGLPLQMIERNAGSIDVTTDFDYATPV
ncbi:MAG: hypothetical protein ABIO74_10960, partial [Dokdonella sp.]